MIDPIEKLKGLSSWLQNILDTRLKHVGYSDVSGHPHGGASAEIPEWELRRHLYEINEILKGSTLIKTVTYKGHRIDIYFDGAYWESVIDNYVGFSGCKTEEETIQMAVIEVNLIC